MPEISRVVVKVNLWLTPPKGGILSINYYIVYLKRYCIATSTVPSLMTSLTLPSLDLTVTFRTETPFSSLAVDTSVTLDCTPAGDITTSSFALVTVAVIVPYIVYSVAVIVVVATARLVARSGLASPIVCIVTIASLLLAQLTRPVIFTVLSSS